MNESKQILGIIGGLGPAASAYFIRLITDMTDAEVDQEHIEILLHSAPTIPDRTAYIIGRSQDSPLPMMIKIGQELVASGAEQIAIPCITAHYFHKELETGIGIPVINGIYETARYLKERGIGAAGIMATDGTLQSGIFADVLEREGIRVVKPDEETQRLVMGIIYDSVKAGRPVDMEAFNTVSFSLRSHGAQVVLLGCTELSLVKRDNKLGAGYLDVMEVLAQSCVLRCGKLKDSARDLITK